MIHGYGYVYVPNSDEGAFSDAPTRGIARNSNRKPPFIAVHRAMKTIIITRWPGKLLMVDIIDPVTKEDLSPTDFFPTMDSTGYTRAVAVKIQEQVPIHKLFGQNGEQVVTLINAASNLTESQVSIISKHFIESNADLYDKAWNVWLKGTTGLRCQSNSQYRDMLSSSGSSDSSPIGIGFRLISSTVFRRAEEIANDTAVLVDEEGEYELNVQWSRATSILLQAAMSYASESLLNEKEREMLLMPWKNSRVET